MKDDEPPVNAEVLLFSADGKDPYGQTITSANIEEFLPGEDDIEFLKGYFEQQHLHLIYYAGISATLVGSQQQIETLFQVVLNEEEGSYSLESSQQHSDDPTIIPKQNLPDDVQDKISVITLPPKPDTFR